MNLYIVDYWVDFPKSEYGGMVLVAAESGERAALILIDNYADDIFYNRATLQDVRDAVSRARVLRLADDVEPGIVDGFVT